MSAPTVSVHDAICDKKMAVSYRLLLGLYAIIPFCLFLQCVDSWLLQDFIRINLPSRPDQFVLFQIMFGAPHIVASNILLASNADYLEHYKKNILLFTAAIALAYFVGMALLPYRLLFALVACWTVYHVLKQQYGIVKGVCQLPEWLFKLLLTLSVSAGFAIYLGIFLRNSLEPQQAIWIRDIAGTGSLMLFAVAIVFQEQVTTSFGRWFYWANIFMVLSSFYLFQQQQYLMAILLPRFIHDATAYVFYVTHDYNKHNRKPQNCIYRYSARCKVPVILVLPVISFALAFALQAYGDEIINSITRNIIGHEFYKVVSVGFLGYLALMHYYMEGLTWQKDSPYRQHIAFRK
jgi:hypothetical protein